MEDEKITRLLNSLKKRFEAGEISQPTYLRLRQKYKTKIASITKSPIPDGAPTLSPSEPSALLDLAMKSVLTRAYVCDNCGAAIQIKERQSTTRCTYCGVTNEVDYLEKISRRFEEEKKKLLRSVVSGLVVSSMADLKMPAFMKFRANALPHENKATENESKAWPRVQSVFRANVWVKDQCFEASKHRHYAAELHQNASEFASKSEDKMEALASYHLNEGLGFLDASLAFLWIVKQEPSLICKRRMATSAFRAVKSFVEAYNLSHNTATSNYAVLSKMLVYKGGEFWLRQHETQEMLALALYLNMSPRGQVWDTAEIMGVATDIANELLNEKSR